MAGRGQGRRAVCVASGSAGAGQPGGPTPGVGRTSVQRGWAVVAWRRAGHCGLAALAMKTGTGNLSPHRRGASWAHLGLGPGRVQPTNY